MRTARAAVQALVEGGMEHVVLCPGSRSAPLAYALAEAEARGEIEVSVRLDERDAGFLALGASVASGLPVGVVTTSGTAVGELLPAVMEADHAGVELVVLSADRPAELHGTGANQTTVQAGLYGVHVRTAEDVAAGEDPVPAVRRALLAAGGLIASETDGVRLTPAPRGPVQVNLCFRAPLTPAGDAAMTEALPDAAGTAPAGASPAARRVRGTDEELLDGPSAGPVGGGAQEIGELYAAGGMDFEVGQEPTTRPDPAAPLRAAAGTRERRSVVVAGHAAGPVAAAFAEALGLPLLAEPSSDARGGETAVATYQYLLGALGEGIEAVVLFGRPTLSRPVSALLEREDIESVLYLSERAPWFEPGRRRERVVTSLEEAAAVAGTAPQDWTATWLRADAAVRAAVQEQLLAHEAEHGVLTGPGLATSVWDGLGEADLVLGSSRPIRDLDLLAAPQSWPTRRVMANRGLAGIDGTLATAHGAALATGRRTVVLLGDVTFLHDAGGLLTPELERVPRLDVVVAQDGGGTIFSTLEHGSVAARGPYAHAVDRFFRTPPGTAAAPVAAAYGWDTESASTREQVLTWLAAGEEPDAPQRRLLEVAVESADPRGLHARLEVAAAEALRAL